MKRKAALVLSRLLDAEWPFVVLCSVVAALVVKSQFGVFNHNSYLIHGLRLYDPDILSNDWFATGTPSIHPVFTHLVAALFACDWGSYPFVITNYLFSFLLGLLIWGVVCRSASRPQRLALFLVLMSLVALGKTIDVMGSNIVGRVFQPSTIGGIGFLAAILAFLSGRFFFSGLLLAVGGVFHLNYLLLGFPVFFIAHVAIDRPSLFKRLSLQLAPSLVAVLPFVPLFFSAAAAPDVAAARNIFFHVRSPHHYVPEIRSFHPFIAWHCLAAAACLRSPLIPALRRPLPAILLTMFTLVMAATLLTSVVFVSPVAQLFFWRLAPFSTLLAQLLVLRWAWEAFLGSKSEVVTWKAALLGVSLVLISALHTPVKLLLLLAIPVLRFVERAAVRRETPLATKQRMLLVAALLIWACGALIAVKDLRLGIQPLPAQEAKLYEWAGTTPVGAMFLIPPDLENFRLNARRAVVVDWKSAPFDSANLLEWYRRLETISGRPDLANLEDARLGYSLMTPDQLGRLRSEFDFDYSVHYRSDVSRLSHGLEVAFENDRFLVLEAGGE